MLLPLQPLSIDRFYHNAESKHLVAEISDLGPRAFQRLYDDACDEGLSVYNARTGSTTIWAIETTCCVEYEITEWILRPIDASCRKHPSVQNYVMHIAND